MREKTGAHRKLEDNVSANEKQSRLRELNSIFEENLYKELNKEVGRYHLVLVDKKDKEGRPKGKTDTFRDCVLLEGLDSAEKEIQLGDFVEVQVIAIKGRTLITKFISHSSITKFAKKTRQFPLTRA